MLSAEALIVHPARILLSGASGSGKTTLAVYIMNSILRREIDRFIIICPTWETQDIFRCMDDIVQINRDVIQDAEENNPFQRIKGELIAMRKHCQKKGVRIRVCLFIDDMAGTPILHGGLITPFSSLSTQMRNLDLSCLVLTQQPKLITPSFRLNSNYVISFPATTRNERDWLYAEMNLSLIHI
jgi:GTPase SAR1 family protein